MLRAAVSAEAERGSTVLFARCAEPRTDLAVARQLFAGHAVPEVDGDPYPAFRALCAHLSAPVVLVMDDAQDCDELSLRWLDFALRRHGTTVSVVLAQRTDLAVPAPDLLAEVVTGFDVVDLAPLTPAQTGELIASALPEAPASEYVELAGLVTGGGPGRLVELLAATREDLTIDRAVLREALATRLRRQSDRVRSVAAALAVLGRSDAELVGPLVGMSAHEVAVCMAVLDEERLLGNGLPQPQRGWVRECALDTADPEDVARLRRRAALLVDESGRPVAEVAKQLSHLDTIDEAWQAQALKEATATAALSSDVAQRCLILLVERSPDDVGARLGLAEELSGVDAESAARHLMTAFSTTADPELRAEVAVRFALTARSASWNPRARELIASADRSLDDPLAAIEWIELRKLLLAVGLWLEIGDPATAADATKRALRWGIPRGLGRAERCLLGVLAEANARSGGPLQRSVELARRSLSGDIMVNDWSMLSATRVLRLAGLPSEARGVLDRAATRFEGVNATAKSRVLTERAAISLAGGDPRAERDARAALDLTTAVTLGESRPMIVLATALARLDDAAGARRVLATIDPAKVGEGHQVDHLYACALAEYAAGDVRAAAQFLSRGADVIDKRGGAVDPAWMSLWVELTAFAKFARLPDESEAAAARVDDLAARWGTAEASGYSALVRAVTGSRPQPELAREAVDSFATAQVPAAQAWAELVLGVFHRRMGDDAQARAHLRTSAGLAMRCGYRQLAARARAHLVAAGGRVRVTDLGTTALGGLTESERRVVEMAAAGASNGEIARKLFVTLRTVEKHLTGAYQKLGVSGRTDLPELVRMVAQRRPA